jgi:hypothetical protein
LLWAQSSWYILVQEEVVDWQMKKKYIYWQDDDMWLGYFEEYPDYWTQGEGSPVHMVISFFNQKSKLVAVRESYQNLQSHKPAA